MKNVKRIVVDTYKNNESVERGDVDVFGRIVRIRSKYSRIHD